MELEPSERSIREVREHLADVINDAIQGRITYITSRGRRVAAVVPLAEYDRKILIDDHEYDEGYEAARCGDWTLSEVAAQSASWQAGYRAGQVSRAREVR